MTTTTLTTATVRAFFDAEARQGRRLRPDPDTASGLGSYVKYCCATALMAQLQGRRVVDVGCGVGAIDSEFGHPHPDHEPRLLVERLPISADMIRPAARPDLKKRHARIDDG